MQNGLSTGFAAIFVLGMFDSLHITNKQYVISGSLLVQSWGNQMQVDMCQKFRQAFGAMEIAWDSRFGCRPQQRKGDRIPTS